MKGIIYKYVSPSGKVYIGQTVEEKKRRRIFNNMNQSYGGVKIDNARKKYGPQNFDYIVLLEVESDDIVELKTFLNQLEIGFIRMYDSYNNGYNSTLGGESLSGFHPTEESRLKMRNSHLGHKCSEESKIKMSKTRKGKGLSEEHRKKISESRRGIKFSTTHCENIGKSKIGRKCSEEQKQKMREKMKGRQTHLWTDEMRKKLSESMTGKKDSEEVRIKKSESAKLAWEKRKTHK